MACFFECDNCGKRQQVTPWPGGWFKPDHWYERSDKDGTQTVCSRKCIEELAAKTGKTNVVLPI